MSLNTSYCVCTVEKTKTRVQLSGKFSHNLRLHEVKNADPERRALNEVLIGDDNIKDIFQVSTEEAAKRYKKGQIKTYIDYTEEAKKQVEESSGHKVRKDAVLAVEVVLTYSSKKDDIPLEDWKKANVDWLCDYFGGKENVVSCVFHNDETNPHIHALVIPIDRERDELSLNAKKWLGGKAMLSKMQTSYGEAMAQFGLSRGEQNSRASHQDLQDFYHALNNVVRQKLPERSQFKDEVSYRDSIDAIYKDTVIRMFALEQAIKRLETVDKTRESNHSIYRELAESKITDYEEQIQILQSNLTEAEKKAIVVENLQAGVAAIAESDAEKAERVRNELNSLMNKGKTKRKNLEKQEEHTEL